MKLKLIIVYALCGLFALATHAAETPAVTGFLATEDVVHSASKG